MATLVYVLLIAGDGPLADGLTSLLAAALGVSVINAARDLHTTVEMIRQWKPAAIVLDCGLFGQDTAATIRRLCAASANTKLVALANDVQQQRAAKGAGAHIVVLKGSRPADLASAVSRCLPEDERPSRNHYLA